MLEVRGTYAQPAREGFDRAAFHAELDAQMLAFFRRTLPASR
jgi:predicted dienelactone hydrolase